MVKTLKNPKEEFWKAKLKDLEDIQLPKAMERVGLAGVGGDWHENAEYEDAERQLELIRTRIRDIKGLIFKLKKEKRI